MLPYQSATVNIFPLFSSTNKLKYDSKHLNIIIKKKNLKQHYHIIYKTKGNIFLSEPTETILKQKKELSENYIQFLKKGYKKLFHDLAQQYKGQRYIAITNIN